MQVPADRPERVVDLERPAVSSDLYESRSARLVPSIKRGLVILVAAALVTSAAGLLRYHPLAGTGVGAVSGEGVTTTGTRSVARFSDGGTFTYSFSVLNAGRWGITLTGVRPPVHGAFADTTVTMTGPDGAPASSFALAPGETAVMDVRVTFAACQTPPPVGARAAWDREVLTYRVMGVASSMAVELPYRLVVDSAAAPRC